MYIMKAGLFSFQHSIPKRDTLNIIDVKDVEKRTDAVELESK